MALVICPTLAQAATAPAVGIFWSIGNALLIDRTVLAEAEPYGDCLTHGPGHYERWNHWQAQGAARLRTAGFPPQIAFSEYDDWPRGRVVYELQPMIFVIYMDRRLMLAATVAAVKSVFGISDTDVSIRGDAHYRQGSD